MKGSYLKIILLLFAKADAFSTRPLLSPIIAQFQPDLSPTKIDVKLNDSKLSSAIHINRGGDGSTNNSVSIQKVLNFVEKNFFILGMVVSISLASTVPSLGADSSFLRPNILFKKFGVSIIFFLSGLSLSLQSLKDAINNHSLNASIQMLSFIFWPFCIALPFVNILKRLNLSFFIDSTLLDGILMMSTLPTTVNMCVILSSNAGGNVATALCNAVLGNLLGIFVTPALLYKFYGKQISLPFVPLILKLIRTVLAPVVIGQITRIIFTKDIYEKRKKNLKRFQEIILLGIAWNAFSNAFLKGFGLTIPQTISLLICLPSLHLLSFFIIFTLYTKFTSLPPTQVISALYCGSHKTLAFGLPLLQTIFEGDAKLALYCAPLMFIHPMQLMFGSLFVKPLQEYAASIE